MSMLHNSQKHVAVLMGGTSSEREISLRSGNACADALVTCGYHVSRIDVGLDIATVLTQLKPDVAFNALHGPQGEDGLIQGLLEMLHIPYTHSGVLSSALSMHKEHAKTIMHAAGVAVPTGFVMDRREVAKSHPMEPPYVIKPVSEGSSYGVFIMTREKAAELKRPPQELARDDWAYGDAMLVERYIAGRELTCAVMGDKALDVIEILPATGRFYDFDAKYIKGRSIHVLPAKIKPNIYQKVQELTLTAHKALGCRGVSRADLRYDDTLGGTGELVVLEVNTQPGMTTTSLVPELAAYAGYSFGEFVQWILEDASLNR
jgi:D-alanine-D-alanine ligase